MDSYSTTSEVLRAVSGSFAEAYLVYTLAEARVRLGKYVLLGQTPCAAVAGADKKDRSDPNQDFCSGN